MNAKKVKYTSTTVHGLPVSKRAGDGRLFCQQCEVPLDQKGGCDACKKLKKAWLDARIQHYADTRHPQTLAQMVVELEDSYDVVPEFAIDEDWPT
jgi:hypothetical protein